MLGLRVCPSRKETVKLSCRPYPRTGEHCSGHLMNSREIRPGFSRLDETPVEADSLADASLRDGQGLRLQAMVDRKPASE